MSEKPMEVVLADGWRPVRLSGRFTTWQSSFWTEANVAKLKALNAEHRYSCKQMAEMLRITRNAVIGKLHRMQVKINTPAECNPTKRKRPRPPKGRMLADATPKPKPEPAPIVELASEPPATTWVKFIDLEWKHCRFPVSGAPGPEMWCCGATRVSNHCSYCEHHRRKATTGNR